MKNYDWQGLLSKWNEQLLKANENPSTYYYQELPVQIVKSGWVGHSGASESQIEQAEFRLSTTLPPSYIQF